MLHLALLASLCWWCWSEAFVKGGFGIVMPVAIGSPILLMTTVGLLRSRGRPDTLLLLADELLAVLAIAALVVPGQLVSEAPGGAISFVAVAIVAVVGGYLTVAGLPFAIAMTVLLTPVVATVIVGLVAAMLLSNDLGHFGGFFLLAGLAGFGLLALVVLVGALQPRTRSEDTP